MTFGDDDFGGDDDFVGDDDFDSDVVCFGEDFDGDFLGENNVPKKPLSLEQKYCCYQ